MKSKVFLSKSQNQSDKHLDKFVNLLGSNPNIDLWTASQKLKLGDILIDTIYKAIANSDYFINVFSYGETHWLRTEMELAAASEKINQKVKIVNVVLESNDSKQRFLEYGGPTMFDLSIDFETNFAKLLNFLSINKSDSLVQFELDKLTVAKPILEITSDASKKYVDYFVRHPNKLKSMDRRLFEEFIAELFYGFNYEVELTQQTRDGGRDIIAIKNSEVQTKYLIECKRPDNNNVVGIRPVRELYGVKQDEKATKAILATTTYFSKDAKQFFERNKWELEPRDFNGIIHWINDYKKKFNIS